jgi:hypothetical protein
MRPDNITVSRSPSSPILAAVAATNTMKAPAGPPIWKRLPLNTDTKAPPMMAV